MAAITLGGLAAWGLGSSTRTDEQTGPPEPTEPPEPARSGCVLYTAGSLHEAQLVLDCLEDAGIGVQLFNQHLVGALGELPMSQCWPKIWLVDRADLADARAVVKDYEQRKDAHTQAVRVCGGCGEESPGNFELCWSCREPFEAE